jgi:predicted SnoaL-like aldol condensation-catalyzing enzyme
MPETNKDRAVSFLKLASSVHVRVAFSRFVGPGFKHHNPFFEGSAEPLMTAMEENARENPDKLLEVKHVIAEGDLVAVHAFIRHTADEPGFALVHIFRFEGGRIVELWDVGQPVPEKSLNQYEMF